MVQASSHAEGGHEGKQGATRSLGLLVAAVGVVYGDIGTSPLYTLKEVFTGGYGVPVNHDGVLGILSLILWSLLWVVSFKYVMFILRADNQGEGGTMALTALARRATAAYPRLRTLMVICGLIGASLFYGDSMITPAVSVLSAVEGMGLAFDGIDHWVVPISLVVLVALFLVQKHGTEKIGKLFGPIMVTWFVVLGALGVHGISQSPEVLKAFNPGWAVNFFVVHPGMGVAILGAVVLALTGAEALYADMGHFGRKPIARAWFILVLPALVLNYFGQGALLLQDPDAARNPFYLLAPGWALLPLVGLAIPGHGDRLAGSDFRGLLLDPPGHPAGLYPAHADPAHLQRRARADLYRCGELDPDGGCGTAGDRFRVLRGAGGSLRCCGNRDHADDHDPGVGGDAAAVEVAAAAGGADSGRFPAGRRAVLCRQRAENCPGWRFPGAGRGRAVPADEHLETWQADLGRAHRRRGIAAAVVHQQYPHSATAPGRRHGGVPDRAFRCRAACATAQHAAQPGAA